MFGGSWDLLHRSQEYVTVNLVRNRKSSWCAAGTVLEVGLRRTIQADGKGIWSHGRQNTAEIRKTAVSVISPYPERIFIKVRRFSFHHFYCHDPKWPDVHFGAISFSCYNFRCHPVRSPHHCAPFTLLRGDLSTEAKISWGEKQAVLKPAWIMKPRKRTPTVSLRMHCGI